MIWQSGKDGVTITLAWDEVRGLCRALYRGLKGGFWRSVFFQIADEEWKHINVKEAA